MMLFLKCIFVSAARLVAPNPLPAGPRSGPGPDQPP